MSITNLCSSPEVDLPKQKERSEDYYIEFEENKASTENPRTNELKVCNVFTHHRPHPHLHHQLQHLS